MSTTASNNNSNVYAAAELHALENEGHELRVWFDGERICVECEEHGCEWWDEQ